MKVVFLGTGTSQGVPMIAQPKGGCDLSNPKNWRTRSSIHIEMGGHHIQVDAGPEFRMQCIHNKILTSKDFIMDTLHPEFRSCIHLNMMTSHFNMNGRACSPIFWIG